VQVSFALIATAIVFYESLTGGTLLARNLCACAKKPFIALDAKQRTESTATAAIVRFADENYICVLNVAGQPLEWLGGGASDRGASWGRVAMNVGGQWNNPCTPCEWRSP
jgi:hypothetical protein